MFLPIIHYIGLFCKVNFNQYLKHIPLLYILIDIQKKNCSERTILFKWIIPKVANFTSVLPLGFEPRTLGLKIPYSNQLSYRSISYALAHLYIIQTFQTKSNPFFQFKLLFFIGVYHLTEKAFK